MTRSQLKRTYNILLVVALGVGFALGYGLKSGAPVRPGAEQRPAHRAYDAEFPGCRSTYLKLKAAYTRGPFRRVDFSDVLPLIEEAIAQNPDYLPFYTLKAKILEEWYTRAKAHDIGRDALKAIARQLALPALTSASELAEHCRRAAIDVWTEMTASRLCRDVRRYGDQWATICEQHLNALRGERAFRPPLDEEGHVDLTLAFDRWAITRDHDRYVNNLSALETGLTFEEKHMPDVLYCPQHPEVSFIFPCLPHLPASGGRTVREDIEFFCTAFAVDKQTLDIPDRRASAVHLLCFNVTADLRPVRAAVHLEYADGTAQTVPIVVGPWRQNPTLLRDIAARRQLDAAYRDTEYHMCNGEEVEMTTAPMYLYHVTVPAQASKDLDKISFPRYDPTMVGLEDPGIADVRIVAVTVR